MTEIQLPKGGRLRAALYGLLATGALAAASPSIAETRAFSGQLDYGAFKRAADRKETIRITYSPGGTGAAALALARAKVVIDGQCNSACAWSFVKNENACFTARAVFGFHAAHDPGTGRRMNAATTYWLSTVRSSLRGKLSPLLETSSLITVTASQMRAHYGDRVCGAAPKTEVASNEVRTQTTKTSAIRTADARTKDRTRTKPDKAVRGETTAGVSSSEQLVLAIAMLSPQLSQPEASDFDTLQSFAKTDLGGQSFGDVPDRDLAIEREAAFAMLAMAGHPEADMPLVDRGFVEVASATGTAPTWPSEALELARAGDGRVQPGLSVAGEDPMLFIAEVQVPIAAAAFEAARRESAPLENETVLAQLADPALRPDDCEPETQDGPVVKLDEVSAGPCEARSQRADLPGETAG